MHEEGEEEEEKKKKKPNVGAQDNIMSANQVIRRRRRSCAPTVGRGLSLAQTNKVGPPERMESERRSSQHSPRVLGRSIRITAVNRVCRFYFPLIHVVFRAFGVPRGAPPVFAFPFSSPSSSWSAGERPHGCENRRETARAALTRVVGECRG